MQESFQQNLLSASFVPEAIIIGTQTKKQKHFDDRESLHKIGGHSKINGISVFWDKHGIIGLEMYYKIGKTAIGDFLKSTHNKPSKPEKNHGALFEIGPDDYLLEINGRFKQGKTKTPLVSLGFLTFKGKKAMFGHEAEDAEVFSHKFENHSFGVASGGHRDYIEFLQFTVVQPPKEFLDEFKPVHLNFNVNHNHVLTAEIQRQAPGAPPAPFGGSTQANSNFMQITMPKIPVRSYTNPVALTHQPQQQQQQQQQAQQQMFYPPQQQQQVYQQPQALEQVPAFKQQPTYGIIPMVNIPKPFVPTFPAPQNNQQQNQNNGYQAYQTPSAPNNNFSNQNPYNNAPTFNAGNQPQESNNNNGGSNGLSMSKYPTLKK